MVLGLEQEPCKSHLELPTTLEQPAPITPLTQWWQKGAQVQLRVRTSQKRSEIRI